MPMVNGQWQEEDAGVESRVAGMLKTDSPLMRSAQADALKMGNKRGLMNSSMTAQAGTKAALDVAVPIASQEAGQIHARNLSGQQFGQEDVLQGKRIASSEKIVGIQEAGMDRRLGQEITSREGIAGADRSSRENIAGREITSREGIARLGEEGAMARTRLTEQGATDRNTANITSTNQNSAADRTSRETIARDDRNATTQTAVGNAVIATNNAYTTGYSAIMSNPNIPPDERARQLTGLQNRRDADVAIVEDVFNVDLEWNNPQPSSTGTTQPAPAPAPAPAPTYPTMPDAYDPFNQDFRE